MAEGYYTVAGAARKLGVDFTDIIAAIRGHWLKASRVRGEYHITEDSLMKFAGEYFESKQKH